jgi:hypothetical protein
MGRCVADGRAKGPFYPSLGQGPTNESEEKRQG